MQLDPNRLSMGERASLRQLMRAKAGQATVRDAREHMAPGGAFVAKVAAMTLLAIGLGVVFLPFLLVAFITPVWLPLRQRRAQARWRTLLPPDQDGELVTLG